MSITFRCQSCGKAIKVKDELAGRRGRCSCGAVVIVPKHEPILASASSGDGDEDLDSLLAGAAAMEQSAPAVDTAAPPSIPPIQPIRAAAKPVRTGPSVPALLGAPVLALIKRLKFVLITIAVLGVLLLIAPFLALALFLTVGPLLMVIGVIMAWVKVLTADEPISLFNPLAVMFYTWRRFDRTGTAIGLMVTGIAMMLAGVTIVALVSEVAFAPPQLERAESRARPQSTVNSAAPSSPARSSAPSPSTNPPPPRDPRVGVAVRSRAVTTRTVLRLPPGDHAPASVPVILVAPAETDFMSGKDFTEGDMAPYQPFVDAGFAVMGYSLSSAVEGDDPVSRAQALADFMAADGGLLNFRQAIHRLSIHKKVDPDQVFVAGYGSSGLIALLAAAKVEEIKGAVVFDPVVNIQAFWRESGLNLSKINREIPGLIEFAAAHSPTQVPRPTFPVLVFAATGDSDSSISDLREYRDSRRNVQLIQPFNSDSGPAMSSENITRAIEFLKEQCGARPVARSP